MGLEKQIPSGRVKGDYFYFYPSLKYVKIFIKTMEFVNNSKYLPVPCSSTYAQNYICAYMQTVFVVARDGTRVPVIIGTYAKFGSCLINSILVIA